MGRKATEGVSSGRLMRQHTPPCSERWRCAGFWGEGAGNPCFLYYTAFLFVFILEMLIHTSRKVHERYHYYLTHLKY